MTLAVEQKTCIRRGTGSKKGRTRSLAPGDAAVRQLHYGRIVLDPGDLPLSFQTEGLETGLICLKGGAAIAIDGQTFTFVPYDSIYIPRDTAVRIAPSAQGCDFAEIAAPVSGTYPLQYIPYETVKGDSSLHFKTGGPASQRTLNILIGKNVQAGRILAGVTFTDPGHWASWPPHEHAAMLEEAYVYIDMPEPGWGIQLVYTDPRNPELAVVVREGDCVVMPAGYHPNVAAPGTTMGFLWMMAAHREVEDRQFGVVNVQPEYAAGGSGLEASRK